MKDYVSVSGCCSRLCGVGSMSRSRHASFVLFCLDLKRDEVDVGTMRTWGYFGDPMSSCLNHLEDQKTNC